MYFKCVSNPLLSRHRHVRQKIGAVGFILYSRLLPTVNIVISGVSWSVVIQNVRSEVCLAWTIRSGYSPTSWWCFDSIVWKGMFPKTACYYETVKLKWEALEVFIRCISKIWVKLEIILVPISQTVPACFVSRSWFKSTANMQIASITRHVRNNTRVPGHAELRWEVIVFSQWNIETSTERYEIYFLLSRTCPFFFHIEMMSH